MTRYALHRTSYALLVPVLLLMTTAPAIRAQLAPPGPAGVVMGHLHLTAKDAGASRTFWTTLGGVSVQNGNLQLLQFPGTFVMVRQGNPVGGTVGSTVDHVTFRVRELPQTGVTSPDDIVVQFVADASLKTPSQLQSISIATVAPDETQAWYVRHLGATAGKSGSMLTGAVPGVTLEFTRAATAPATTRGRALDHIGFEVKNLEEFCKKLEASGLKLDRPFTRLPNSTTAIGFLTDPWGTYIELTENLAPAR